MKTSFIATILNEEKTVISLLNSVYSQTILPDEVIIVDGGSTDETVSILENYSETIKGKKHMPELQVLQKKGNRSVGRNEAMRRSTADIILCSDAGCILDKNWIKEILTKFSKSTDVVAGYYKGKAKTLFQKCLIPYVLVMKDKINPDTFLPASRSMAFTKKIWREAGMFDESLSHNEDYAFAKQLQKNNAQITFAEKAIVYWTPGSTLKEAYIMFWRFAYGDAESGIIRPKVIILFIRYVGFITLATLLVSIESPE